MHIYSLLQVLPGTKKRVLETTKPEPQHLIEDSKSVTMSVASSQQSFLTNALTPTSKPNRWPIPIRANTIAAVTSKCQSHSDDPKHSSSRKFANHRLDKLAMVALTAGLLTIGSVDPAFAGKSGGRVGGQAFRSSAPPPRSSSPRINNSRTNIYVNPPVAPPLVGGYGYGYGVPFYGGWGWSPFSFFAPGPSVAIGVGGGFDTIVLFMFLGAAAAVVRRFFGSRETDDDDY